MQVRAVRGLLRQEVIYLANHGLEVPHSSKRHRPSLAEGSDGMCPEIVEGIRHTDLTSIPIFCSYRTGGLGPPSEDRALRANDRERNNRGDDTPVGTGPRQPS